MLIVVHNVPGVDVQELDTSPAGARVGLIGIGSYHAEYVAECIEHTAADDEAILDEEVALGWVLSLVGGLNDEMPNLLCQLEIRHDDFWPVLKIFTEDECFTKPVGIDFLCSMIGLPGLRSRDDISPLGGSSS